MKIQKPISMVKFLGLQCFQVYFYIFSSVKVGLAFKNARVLTIFLVNKKKLKVILKSL